MFFSRLLPAFSLLCFSSNFLGEGGGWKGSFFYLNTCKSFRGKKDHVLKKSLEVMNKHFIFRFMCRLQLSIFSMLIIALKIQSCLVITEALFEADIIRNSLLRYAHVENNHCKIKSCYLKKCNYQTGNSSGRSLLRQCVPGFEKETLDSGPPKTRFYFHCKKHAFAF